MRVSTLTVRQGALAVLVAQQERLITVGTPAWYNWLETVTLFTFSGEGGAFTARKERRQRGGWYWKAYCTQHGKLVRAYLGKTEHLTLERLEQVAQILADRRISIQSKRAGKGDHAPGLLLAVNPFAPSRPADDPTSSLHREQVLPGAAASAGPLLFTKVAIPPLRLDLIERARLVELLNQAMGHRLILLSAPAGFGKTTLLNQWSAQHRRRVAWVSLDVQDNDPNHFWRYVIAALQPISSGLGQEALELVQAGQPAQLESAIASLLNALLLLEEDITLVLDDYHLISAQSIHDSLAFFLDHLPPRLHLMIASRTDPPLPLAYLRVRQQLAELRASELRFTSEEVARFFTAGMGLHLAEEQLATLATSTEGWIAALQLAALSLKGREDSAGFLRAFTAGAHRSLADYLAEEVLHQQPEALQRFLLHTAILERLHGPLCEAVITDAEDGAPAPDQPGQPGQATLEQLEHANLFLIPLDAERRWYRYHHLFAEFLRERLRRTAPQQLPVLHRRAAAWYEGQGLLADAIHHLLAASDFSRAAQLICQAGEALVSRSEVTLLRQWLEALPDSVMRAHPQLCLLYAWALATVGLYVQAESWLHEAEQGLAELVDGSPPAARRLVALVPLDEAERQTTLQSIAGEIAALRAHSATFWGDIPASLRFAQQALEQLPQARLFLRGLSALNLGIACWLSGNVRSASQALSQARALGQATNNTYIALLATCCLAQVQIVEGKRHLAFKSSQEALRLVSEEGGRALPAAAYAYVGMGQIRYEWNDLDAASYYLEEGITLSERWGNGDMFVYGYTVLAQVKQAQGDTPGALEMIERAERYVQSYQQRPWIVAIMVAQQVRLALMQGNLDAIWRWTEQSEQDYVVIFEEVTRTRIHLAQGQPEQALALLERQAHLAASSGRTGTLLEIWLLQALAYQQQSDTARALHTLEECLSLAEPEGYLRLFIDEGAPMRALLIAWLYPRQPRHDVSPAHQRLIAYVKKLLGMFAAAPAEQTQRDKRRRSFTAQAAHPLLSEREREILRHLAAGKSNEEIANTLVLAVSTVKWHLTRIYSKLNVQSRTQAVLQARLRHLL